MSGAILQPPTRADADWGVLFIEVSGCLPMCGHGTIGVATVLVETGMVAVTEPETVVRLDVPAGLVEARVAVENGRARHVTLRNVPSFLHARDRTVEAEGIGAVAYDMAFGGNFYAIVDAAEAGVEVDPARADELVERGAAVMTAINAADRPVHPDDDAHRGLPPRGLPRARARRRRRPRGDVDPSRLARPLAVRHRDVGADGAAPRPRRASRSARRSSTSRSSARGSPAGSWRRPRSAGVRRSCPRSPAAPGSPRMGQYLLDAEDPFPAGFSL